MRVIGARLFVEMSSPSGRGRLAGLLLAVLAAGGCSRTYIPNTDVEDSDENRDVVAFCEAYRRAIERKDIATLLDMASPHYYEDGGNVDATDDIDYAGLRDYLTDRFEQAAGIRYEIRYRRIERQDDIVFVDYTYSGSFRVPTEDGEKWKSTVEENRLELVGDGQSFKIIAGM
jgi:hypothetical protein